MQDGRHENVFYHLIFPITLYQNVTSYCNKTMTTYASSSYSLTSVMISYILAQMPRHSPQPVQQSKPAMRQEHHRVSHHILQLHRTTFQQRFLSNIHVHVTLHGHQFTLYGVSANILWMQMWTKPEFRLPYFHLKVNTAGG